MNWKTIETVRIVNSEGNTENIEIQQSGNFYNIRNEFGNMSFNFDVSSGSDLIEALQTIIATDINKEVNDFLTGQNFENSIRNENDIKDRQIGLFESAKNINDKNNGLNTKLNKTSNKITK